MTYFYLNFIDNSHLKVNVFLKNRFESLGKMIITRSILRNMFFFQNRKNFCTNCKNLTKSFSLKKLFSKPLGSYLKISKENSDLKKTWYQCLKLSSRAQIQMVLEGFQSTNHKKRVLLVTLFFELDFE